MCPCTDARFHARSLSANTFAAAVRCVCTGEAPPPAQMAAAVGSTAGLIAFASLATKLKPTGRSLTLSALGVDMKARCADKAMRSMRDALASAVGEAALLRAGGDALCALYPRVAAWGIGGACAPIQKTASV